MKKISDTIKNTVSYLDSWFLTSIIFIFSLLRIPSLVEPYWYGDEGIYQVIGIALRQGRILYKEIWDNKPPILYLIYGLFNGDQFSVRLFSLVFGAASIIFFFLLAKKLFQNKISIYVSTTVFSVLFGLPLLEGNIANAENFMLLPIICAFYLILALKQKKQYINYFIAGLLLAFAFLTKIVAIFDFAALCIIILTLRFYDGFSYKRNGANLSDKLNIKKIFIWFFEELLFLLGFIIPIIVSILYFFSRNAFPDYYKAAFSQNVGYVGYGNYFLFPMGSLILKLILLSVSILLVIVFRKKLGYAGIVIFIWVVFSLFNALFSARPYTHYLLVLLPAASLLAGLVLDNKKLLKISLPSLLVVIMLVSFNFKVYKKIYSYYENYMQFVFGGKSINRYQSFFDNITPRDYEIAQMILMKTNKNEEVFIWGDSGQIYALAGKLPPGRYIVSYHITFYKNAIDETRKVLDIIRPKYIIQTKETTEINNFLGFYSLKYTLNNAKIYERQF